MYFWIKGGPPTLGYANACNVFANYLILTKLDQGQIMFAVMTDGPFVHMKNITNI